MTAKPPPSTTSMPRGESAPGAEPSSTSSTPSAPSSLRDKLRSAGLDWIVPEWPAPPEIGAFVTTRRGGVGTGPDATMNLGRNGSDATALRENRCRLATLLPAEPVWLDQVHGTAVATLERAAAPNAPNAPPPVADAAVTRERGVVCAVLTADCLPVLFAERRGRAVGIAHAGWRGLSAGILEATVTALDALDAKPGDLLAWLGPGIGPANFEVGADVRTVFCNHDAGAESCFAPLREGKWLADLYGLARRRLAAVGITQVSGGEHCTFRDAARFFSYRRDRTAGRMAALIWRAPLAPD